MVREHWIFTWSAAATALFGVLLGMTAWTLSEIRDVAIMVRETMEPVTEETSMQTLTSTWKSQGVTHTISTPREQNETVADWQGRHDEALEAALAEWPADG